MTDHNTKNSGEGHDVCPLAACARSAAAIVVGIIPDGDGRKPELMPRSEADDERVALHESCHALAGRVLGSPLGGMTCDPGDGFSGLCWGPSYVRRSKLAEDEPDPVSLCTKMTPLMPREGESRLDVANIFLHCHVRIVELVAGSVGEAMFLGEAWDANDDRAQETALASLICSSPESIEAFVGFCAVEAAALLRPREHIVRALTKELLCRRTMTGAEVDEVIAAAVAEKAAAVERQRRATWKRVEQSAASFAGMGVKPTWPNWAGMSAV
jgi:hypothetical protein